MLMKHLPIGFHIQVCLDQHVGPGTQSMASQPWSFVKDRDDGMKNKNGNIRNIIYSDISMIIYGTSMIYYISMKHFGSD